MTLPENHAERNQPGPSGGAGVSPARSRAPRAPRAPGRVTQPSSKQLRANEERTAAALAILRRALLAEERRGYDDATVVGGLDRLLTRLTEETLVPASSPLATEIAKLLASGYARLGHEDRQNTVATLMRLLGATSAAPPQFITTVGPQSVAPATDRSIASKGAQFSAPNPPPARSRPNKATPRGNLTSPVTALAGVDRRVGARLQTLGIETIQDLLFHFPHRYDDFSQIRPVAQLLPGEQQTLVAAVWTSGEKAFGRFRSGTELIVGDSTGNLRVIFFNQAYLATKFRTGAQVVLSGKVSVFQGQRQMESPEWELIDGSDLAQAVHTGRMVPVYPLTDGLGARSMRRIVHAALEDYLDQVEESLPRDIIDRHGLLPLQKAISQRHYPDDADSAEEARRRLAFDELLVLQLAVLRSRQQRQQVNTAPRLHLNPAAREAFVASLPFQLTRSQQQVIQTLLEDLGRTTPMARLLQGDVGSGKTVVAASALLTAVASERQGVLMAPTEILAEQHFRTLCRFFGAARRPGSSIFSAEVPYLPRPLRIAMLHGGLHSKVKTEVQTALSADRIDIAVGTHALIQEGVEIPRLGVAIVDEQHRFGVAQRAALREKGASPHLLVMTATPIPRTLALTLYGELEISVLDEMPPGRKAVRTRFVPPEQRDHAYRFLRKQIDAGRQAFVICPLVEGSDKLETRAAVEEYERLRVTPELSGARIALLHGRMKTAEKEAVMDAFQRHESDILVSTAVVEVGIDVANATVILIEGADRFGLAQLHQFRGRVGRGAEQSYCLLLADNPSPEANARVRLLEEISDGFALAEADLRLRGPGEYFGTRQSGISDLRLARLTDAPILEQARAEAERLLGSDSELAQPDLAGLLRKAEQLLDAAGDAN